MKTMHTSAALAAFLWSVSLSAATAPPIAKVLVTNPVLPVEVRNADPIVVQDTSAPERSAMRYGPVSGDTFPDATPPIVELVPPVAIGKKFIVAHIATMLESANVAFPLVTGDCTLFLGRPQGGNTTLGAVPLDRDLSGNLQLFLPLNAGESLRLSCFGLAANSVRPSQSFIGTVGGYSVDAD